jgi:GAF domain-containing protein
MHLKSGVRALLAVPLLHQDEVIGTLVVRRRSPGAFPRPIVNLMLQNTEIPPAVNMQI